MHPPLHIIDKLHRIDPAIRLGWGPPPRPQGKIGDLAPRLALILISPARKADSIITGDLWLDRGPIFGERHDPATQTPVALAFYDLAAMSWDDIVQIVQQRADPRPTIAYEMALSAQAYGAMAEDDMVQASGEMGEELHWRSQRSDAASPEPVPRKHLTKEEKQVLAGDHESQKPLTDIFDDCIPK